LDWGRGSVASVMLTANFQASRIRENRRLDRTAGSK
jgi:hypothetical protein